jgi:hypothetical protein
MKRIDISRKMTILLSTLSIPFLFAACFNYTEMESPNGIIKKCSADKVVDSETCLDCFCAAETETCYNNSDCVDLSYCVFDCGSDQSCVDECAGQYPYGTNDLVGILNCLDDNCADYIVESCECSSGEYICDGDYLQMCDDGCTWTSYDCNDLCITGGYDYTTGCSYSSDTGDDTCWCDYDSSCECSSGDTLCNGDYLQMCDDGCNWTSYDCNELCITDGYDYTTGCSYSSDVGNDVCLCDYSSSCECSSGDTLCNGDYLQMCDDGCNWTSYDCNELCITDGYDYTTGCSYSSDVGNDVCWCDYTSSTDSTISLGIIDECDDGYRIDFRFYDIDNNLVWPSSTTNYYTPGYGTTVSNDLSCVTGATICFGAATGEVYWGVGLNNEYSCIDCCVECIDGASSGWNLTCD